MCTYIHESKTLKKKKIQKLSKQTKDTLLTSEPSLGPLDYFSLILFPGCLGLTQGNLVHSLRVTGSKVLKEFQILCPVEPSLSLTEASGTGNE